MYIKKFTVPGFLMIVSLFVSLIVQAQKNIPNPEERANQLTEWMRTNLELQSNQVQSIQTINLKYAHKTQDLLNSSLSRNQKKRALRADGDARDRELKKNLTADQFQMWLAKKEEAKKTMRQKMSQKG